MRPRRLVATIGLSCLALATLSACGVIRGAPDRVDGFVAAGHDCTASWWLGDVRAGVDEEARLVAEVALAEAEVSDEAWDAKRSLLDLAMDDDERQRTSAVDLDAAGYPDNDRAIEMWSDRNCS